jgi:hypothetical protein
MEPKQSKPMTVRDALDLLQKHVKEHPEVLDYALKSAENWAVGALLVEPDKGTVIVYDCAFTFEEVEYGEDKNILAIV